MCKSETDHVHETRMTIALESSALLKQGNDQTKNQLPKARKLLLLSHLFAMFSDISWQFCLILFLAAFANYESLMLVSTYGLFSGLAVCLFGSTAGQFIDTTNRLKAARMFIWSQNLCVILATTCCYLLLSRQTVGEIPDLNPSLDHDNGLWTWALYRFTGVPSDPLSIFLLILIHGLGAAAQLLSRGFVVAIERDWIVVMSHTANELEHESNNSAAATADDDDDQLGTQRGTEWLSETNMLMKQIDLSCKVGSPAIAGFVIAAFDQSGGSDGSHGSDLRGATIMVGVLNVSALVVEYICTAMIYRMVPRLSESKEVKEACDKRATNENEQGAFLDLEGSDRDEEIESGLMNQDRHCIMGFIPNGLRVYFEQSVSMAGLALSLLYLNALTFGGLMTAYLVWRGMRFETVGIWRGVSSAIGLLGTFVYYSSTKRISIESTGMWSITYQFACLTLSYASLFVGTENDTLSLSLLIGGVCASRIGLWVFDISMTQLMQQNIPSHIRGLTGGVQEAMNAFFGLLSFALGIVFPDPKDFHIYIAAGYACVGIAMLLYGFAFRLRFRRSGRGQPTR